MNPAVAVATDTRSSADPGERGRATAGHQRLADPIRGLPVFIAGLLGWQIALLLALLAEVVGPAGYVTIHLGGCAGLAAWLLWRARIHPMVSAHALALQALGWSALAGPFGAFVALAFVLARAADRSDGAVADAAMAAAKGCAMTPAQAVQIAVLDRRMRLEGSGQARALMDVMAEGSQAQKLEVLGVVYKRYDAALSAVLKQALRDSDASVRVLAATVMSKLHANYTRSIGDWQNATAAASPIALNWRKFAEARLAYAESGLLDKARARAEIELAVEALARAVDCDPRDQEAPARLDQVRRQLAAFTT